VQGQGPPAWQTVDGMPWLRGRDYPGIHSSDLGPWGPWIPVSSRASAQLRVPQMSNPWEGDVLALPTRARTLHVRPTAHSVLPLGKPVCWAFSLGQHQQGSAPSGAVLSVFWGPGIGISAPVACPFLAVP